MTFKDKQVPFWLVEAPRTITTKDTKNTMGPPINQPPRPIGVLGGWLVFGFPAAAPVAREIGQG